MKPLTTKKTLESNQSMTATIAAETHSVGLFRRFLFTVTFLLLFSIGFAERAIALMNCPDGYSRNTAGDCVRDRVDCKSGSQYDTSTNSCKPNCTDPTTVWDPVSQICVSGATRCNSSEKWNGYKCVPLVFKQEVEADCSITGTCEEKTITTTIYANPGLKECLDAAPPKADGTRPDSDYDCAPTPRDGNGITNRDYKTWNGVLYGKGDKTTPVTGFYSMKGSRCDVKEATADCPIALKALYVYNCDSNDSKNGKCFRAKSVEVYQATYQAIAIKGQAMMPTKIVGDKGLGANVVPATPVSATQFAAYTAGSRGTLDCKNQGTNFIQIGTDQYGAAICGADPNQATIDAQGRTIASQESTLNAQAQTINAMKKQLTLQQIATMNEKGGGLDETISTLEVLKELGLNPWQQPMTVLKLKDGTNLEDCLKKGKKVYEWGGIEKKFVYTPPEKGSYPYQPYSIGNHVIGLRFTGYWSIEQHNGKYYCQ